MFTDYAENWRIILVNSRRIKKYFEQLSENPPVSSVRPKSHLLSNFQLKTQVLLIPVWRIFFDLVAAENKDIIGCVNC